MVYKAIAKPAAEEYYVMTLQGCSNGLCVDLKGIAFQTNEPGNQIRARLVVDGCDLHMKMTDYPPGYDSNQWSIDRISGLKGRCMTIPASVMGPYTFRSTCFWSSDNENYENATEAAADCLRHPR